MKYPSLLFVFLLLLSLAVAYELISAGSLPTVVASHFVAGGNANGFMARNDYLGLMLSLTVGLPVFVAAMSCLVRFIPARLINLPDREYWLAPERSDETFAFLQNHGVFFGVLMALFLCFVHWLVVRANGHRPPIFPEALFNAGFILFLVAIMVWLGVFVAHFRRRP
jgi:hypothetical protein